MPLDNKIFSIVTPLYLKCILVMFYIYICDNDSSGACHDCKLEHLSKAWNKTIYGLSIYQIPKTTNEKFVDFI